MSDWNCTSCGAEDTPDNDVDLRYSYGIYAGRLCRKCCFNYNDHCGIDQEQGNPYDLDEQIDEVE